MGRPGSWRGWHRPRDAMNTEISARADFTILRYAQVWEDADVLLKALSIEPGDECLSICSAGDNALAMLAKDPARVVALDLNPAQLACLELRIAAFRTLEHREILELIGSLPSNRRAQTYGAIRKHLSPSARDFWDGRPEAIARGAGSAGRFENYFRLFRRRILPLVHSRRRVAELLQPKDRAARIRFYENEWNTWRWRLLFTAFFSRFAMGRFGRDPSFFRYVEGSVAAKILERTRHALTELDPQANPYLQWILTGRHLTALPYYLREENFSCIRKNLDRMEWHQASLEDYLSNCPPGRIARFNLSDIFEYMSPESTRVILGAVTRAAKRNARIAYWNMLVPRSAPADLPLQARSDLARELHLADKAFFYNAFVVEEIRDR